MGSSADVLLDTSAAVPFLVPTHPDHSTVFAVLAPMPKGLSGHALFETYSILTRLPGDLKIDAVTAVEVIEGAFPVRAQLSVRAAAGLLPTLARRGIQAGSVYDALVGAAAMEHDLPLITRDRRAEGTYRKLGVKYRLLD